jgi:hypothetical protein
MQFAGIVDYDDMHVPLYSNNEPLALVIGDVDCLHLFTCQKCSMLGVKWQYD